MPILDRTAAALAARDTTEHCAARARQAAARRDLERDLDGLIQAHWVDCAERISVLTAEFNADIRHLGQLATALAAAAQALSALTHNNLSCDGPTQQAPPLADLLDAATDGLLLPSAARVLTAMLSLRLAA